MKKKLNLLCAMIFAKTGVLTFKGGYGISSY